MSEEVVNSFDDETVREWARNHAISDHVKNVTVVSGRGKTTFAEEFAKWYPPEQTVWIQGIEKIETLRFRFNENTKLIIIDNIGSDSLLFDLYNFFSSGRILIERKGYLYPIVIEVKVLLLQDIEDSFLKHGCGFLPNLHYENLDLPF